MCAQRTPLVSQGARTALATAPPLEQLKAGADASLRRTRAAGRLAGEPALLLFGTGWWLACCMSCALVAGWRATMTWIAGCLCERVKA